MEEKIIRSHRVRAEQVKRYHERRISVLDEEAFVEFLLLEDIVKLYEARLKNEREKAYVVPNKRANELKVQQNIAKFSAIINLFNTAIGAARVAIDSGDYKRVWRAIHEGALMTAAKNIKHLPELKKMGIELLRELSEEPEGEAIAEIEEVIRAAEAAIPDRKKTSRLDPNT